MKKNKLLVGLLTLSFSTLCSCSPFLFTGGQEASPIETFGDTNNAIFFALYNYYGYEGQHFTNKWLGMNDALARHGITVTGYTGEKDARKFTIKRESTCDLPDDAVIYMVNNQNWDSSIQFTKPFAKYHPMAVISTCNGVEFASSPILSSGYSISNATMGGFSDSYREAFADGSLRYLCAKYSAHILPIFAAGINAVETGSALKNADGTALRLSIKNWAIQTLEQYDALAEIDSISSEHPTLRKLNVDKFFDNTYATDEEKVAALTEFVSDSSEETIRKYYEENEFNAESDIQRTGEKIKIGIIAPSSINDTVNKYISFIKGYLAEIYNCEVLPIGSVTSSASQSTVATQLCNQGAQFIISLQDDTDRNQAAKICNEKNVYFAIGGSCQNEIDYEVIKDLPYYVGSIGTSPAEERRAADEMTEYYLQAMIYRSMGAEAFVKWQVNYKGLELEDSEIESYIKEVDKLNFNDNYQDAVNSLNEINKAKLGD
jgi:hypothetical protein